ncbi:14-3-3 protein [Histomonas meleagridis]|uniref:14-3-3 protein n=1 Tax=Histomonas meleagridis TaxID=135588 RepID=UPI0035598370|nr:14-3-3 protein [Histomonas meleagridis]
MSDEREQLIYYLRIQYNNGVPNEGMEEQNEYIDMIKKIIELNPVLSEDEKVLLSLVYKNAVTLRRNAIREVETHLQDPSNNNKPARQQKLFEYLTILKSELKDICLDLINLIKDTLLPQTYAGEQRVFYAKMQGDYYRYICENKGEDVSEYITKASQCYDEALAIAKNELSPTSSTYLGVVLNYSVFSI